MDSNNSNLDKGVSQKHNTTISICKGIAIILMVMGHTECPVLLSNFIYVFHMPLFFITAGYFFNRKYLDNPKSFCVKRFKGLYLPFIKYSLLFLLLHNLWFKIGVLNEESTNWLGIVAQPYGLRKFVNQFIHIFIAMTGYDELLCGAFWFFRTLLIASISFFILYYIVDYCTKLPNVWAVVVICVFAWAFQTIRLHFGFSIPIIPMGGIREVWGIFFFGIGVIYRQFEHNIGCRWWLTIICFAVLCVGAWYHWCNLTHNDKLRDAFTLPLTGCAGFLLIRHVSGIIDVTGGVVARMLNYIGKNTIYILVSHILIFKLVSLLKVLWYGLDLSQVGCVPVVHYNNHEDLFWLLYTVVGTALPLLCVEVWRRTSKSISIRKLLKAEV